MGKAKLQKAPSSDAVEALKNEVQLIFAKQAKKDAEVVDAIGRFADVSKEKFEELEAMPDWMLKEKGWTRRELIIAKKSRLPRSKVPFAIQAAHEATLARIRRTEDAQGAGRIGVAIINLPQRAERQDNSRVVVIEATEVKG
jgi:hypothetical protein